MKAALRKVEALKNPAAVALGRLGGLKGGKARAEALTPSQRSKIAKKAAQMRWTREIEAKLKPKTEEKTVSPAAKRGKSVKSPEPSAV